LCRHRDALKATVTDIDWQNVLKAALKVAEDMGVADRVTYKPGDILSIDYGESEFDVAIASNILQSFEPETNKTILSKICNALKPDLAFLWVSAFRLIFRFLAYKLFRSQYQKIQMSKCHGRLLML